MARRSFLARIDKGSINGNPSKTPNGNDVYKDLNHALKVIFLTLAGWFDIHPKGMGKSHKVKHSKGKKRFIKF